MLGEVETAFPLSKTRTIGTRKRMKRRGVTASRTNPGNRAHAFRITVVDKQTPSNYEPYVQLAVKSTVESAVGVYKKKLYSCISWVVYKKINSSAESAEEFTNK